VELGNNTCPYEVCHTEHRRQQRAVRWEEARVDRVRNGCPPSKHRHQVPGCAGIFGVEAARLMARCFARPVAGAGSRLLVLASGAGNVL
jgi:hypothetical protein